MYVMLSGRFPFEGKNVEHDIIEEAHSFPKGIWDKFSPQCKYFIDKLLEKDPSKRLTANEAFKHPWFNILTDEQLKIQTAAGPATDAQLTLNREIIDNLVSYKGQSKLRMAAMNVFIHMLEPKDFEPLRERFHQMDKDKTGFLNASELQAALNGSDVNFTEEQIAKIIKEIDDYGNGKINYSEFLAATISTKRFMTEEKMWMMFKHFDVDDTDYISKDNITEAMAKLGK